MTHRERRDRIRVGHRARRPDARAARRSRGCTRAASRGRPRYRRSAAVPGVTLDDGVDGRAADERNEPEHADEARRGRQREQVVAAEERLQDHVVERERRAARRARSVALWRSRTRGSSPGAEGDDDRDPGECDCESDDVPPAMRSSPSAAASTSVIAGRERDDERSDARASCAARRCSGTGGTRPRR